MTITCEASNCSRLAFRGSQYCSDACKARDWRETRERLGLPTKRSPDLKGPEERKRLESSSIRILGRLLEGRATNVELSKIALRYGARLKELRDRGHDIRIVHREAGLNVYEYFKGSSNGA